MKTSFQPPIENPSPPENSSSSNGMTESPEEPLEFPARRIATLIETDWMVPLGLNDAIQSFLVEHPTTYYMAGNRQFMFYLTREHGLLQIVNDFTMMEEEEVEEYLAGVLEMLYT